MYNHGGNKPGEGQPAKAFAQRHRYAKVQSHRAANQPISAEKAPSAHLSLVSHKLCISVGQDASIWLAKGPAHRQGINIHNQRGGDSRELMLFTVKRIVEKGVCSPSQGQVGVIVSVRECAPRYCSLQVCM